MSICNYFNTKIDIHTTDLRLKYLNEQKLLIYSKYFGSNKSMSDCCIRNNNCNNDKFIKYVNELMQVNPVTGMSISSEIDFLISKKISLESILHDMEFALRNYKGIESDLFFNIVCNGFSISKSVELVALKHDKDVSTIWRIYKIKIKDFVKKLKC